jgi:RNA-dependent RNA polymerase
VMVNWAPSVVEKFKQPDVVDKPDGLEEKNFEDHIELVSSFHTHHANSTPEKVQTSFLTALLRSLDNQYVGKYSNFHSYALYKLGYSHPDTIRLAYMWVQFPSRPAEPDVL